MTRGFWHDRERYLDTYWRRFPGLWVHGDFAAIDEDGGATATFTVTLGGDALTGANTASVDINATGSATSGTDYANFVAALVAAAGATAGVTFDGVDTLTFDSTFNGTGTGAFAFTVDAINDQAVEGTETIIATLSAQSVTNGSAVIATPSAIASTQKKTLRPSRIAAPRGGRSGGMATPMPTRCSGGRSNPCVFTGRTPPWMPALSRPSTMYGTLSCSQRK